MTTASTIPGLESAPTKHAKLVAWVTEIAQLTKPDRVDEAGHHNRYCRGGSLRRAGCTDRGHDNRGGLTLHRFGSQRREAAIIAIRKTQVEDVVPILDKPVVAHSVLESVHKNRKGIC